MSTLAILPALAVVLATEIPQASFPANVAYVDFEESKVCQLATQSADDRIRVRWLPAETSIERMSVNAGKVTARMKVPVQKVAEEDGVALYAYRESNAVVLFAPAKDGFSTPTTSSERMFLSQTCGLAMMLVFSKPPEAEGCNVVVRDKATPGFCGRLARIDGTSRAGDRTFAATAAIGAKGEIRVLLKTKPLEKPSP